MRDPSIDVFRHPEVVIRNGCHQGLMGDAKHLTMLSQDVKQLRHRAADPTADTGINFIKKQGA
jgi:hypothetical protein